jgi:hypothetical protein
MLAPRTPVAPENRIFVPFMSNRFLDVMVWC